MIVVDYLKRVYRKLRHFRFNFIAVHYCLIIGSALFGTFLFYPAKTTAYVDAVFQCACAATQAGLNTVDINSLRLWQQMVLYCISMWTNPIVIHSGVVFMRLHWFEKSFSDINNQSKLQSKLRRTATTLARQDTMENGLFQRPPLRHENRDMVMPGLSAAPSNRPSSPTNKITFGDLPHPKRTHSVEPEDMYRSINMLSTERPEGTSDSEDDGPALVIKGPLDRPERDDDEEETPEMHKAPEPPSQSVRTISFSTQEHPRIGLAAQQAQHELENPIDESESSDATQPISIKREDLYLPNHHDSDSSEAESSVKKIKSNVTFHGTLPEDDRFAGTQPINRRAFTLDHSTQNQQATAQSTGSGLLSSFKHTLSFDRFKSSTASGSGDHKTMSSNYLSWSPTVGRNSAFVDLSEAQKEELGGIEYRALKVLSKVLIAYFVGFHIMCAVMLLPWANLMPKYSDYIFSCGVTPTWWSFFTAQSTFNDVGFTLTPDSMASFQEAIYVLLTMSFFIVIGNTGFPVMLRFIIWIMFNLSPTDSSLKECTGFLLDHPRRCFTMLFPSTATWWLFATLVILNSVDLFFFIILDFDAPAVMDLPPGYRVVNGLFQAFSTRTAGFTSVSISDLHPSIQVSYMIMMYISILPIAISIRRTNVYEEQSLGIYGGHEDELDGAGQYDKAESEGDDEEGDSGDNEHLYDNKKPKKKKHPSYVSAHLRAQLGYDLWYIFLGLFIICICEGSRIMDVSDLGFTSFTILFEVVSAYGTVGMSMGYPGTNTALSGQFTTVSKLVIVAMMIRGRHRGLPYSVDRAIILPSDEMHRKDDAVNRSHLRRARTLSVLSNDFTETMGLPFPMRSHTVTSATGHESYPLRGSSHARSASMSAATDPIVPPSPMPSINEDYFKQEEEQKDQPMGKDDQGIELHNLPSL